MRFRLSTLQRIDRDLGPWACAGLQPLRWVRARRPPEAPVRSILAVKFWGIGSLVLLGPALRALRERHPRARIDLLTLEGNAPLARLLPALDGVVTVRLDGGPLRIACRLLALIAELRADRYDLLLDFEFFTRFSAILAFLSGARRTVGYWAPSVYRGDLHDERVPFNRYWHVTRNFRALAGGGDEPVTAADLLRPRIGEAARSRAARLERSLGGGEERPLVLLNPNAGDLALERRWPADHFAALAERLSLDAAVAWIGAPSERPYVESVRARLARPESTVDLAGELSIEELLALLERARLLVTNDSGPLHLASAVATPTIALFGPETPVMYGPLHPRAVTFYRPPPCSPCINVHENKMHACYFSRAECLVRIPPEEVLAAARELLAETRFSAARRMPVPASS
ncbi:MAG TPA: glycosyltransferase family 9 protein [Planctomycetota bacterium]|nr:glycosyltransferase family 9 protein [Planctomycetota bacterium]